MVIDELYDSAIKIKRDFSKQEIPANGLSYVNQDELTRPVFSRAELEIYCRILSRAVYGVNQQYKNIIKDVKAIRKFEEIFWIMIYSL